MSGVTIPNRYQYVTVAASQTKQAIGGAGAIGDYLHRLIISVNTVASATVTLYDGTAGGQVTIPIMTGASALLGPAPIEMDMASAVAGGWMITTGAGVTVIAVGIFT